jgi:hypothetical protein
MRRSFADSFSSMRVMGMPVMREITDAIISTSTVICVSCFTSFHDFLCSRSFARSSFSLSRSRAAFSNSCC